MRAANADVAFMFTVYAVDAEGREESHEMLPSLDTAVKLIQQMLEADAAAVSRSGLPITPHLRYGLSFDQEGASMLLKRLRR